MRDGMRGSPPSIYGRGNSRGVPPGQIPTIDLCGVTGAEQRRGTIARGRILDDTDVASGNDAGMFACHVT
jgi:hypothetical protein